MRERLRDTAIVDADDGPRNVRILVTDSNTRAALAAARSLGRAGNVVITCGALEPALAGVSKYSSLHEWCPNPARDAEGFARRIGELIGIHRIDVLLPMTEVATLTLASHASVRSSGVKWPFADAATIAKTCDKARVLRLAREIGVPVPRTVEISTASDVDSRAAALIYPVVIKPARSHVRIGERWVATSVSYAYDEKDLRGRLGALPEACFPVLLQERIEGPGVGVFMCFQRNRTVAVFAHERIREKPPSGGVSVLSESRQPDPEAVGYARALLSSLGWRGVAMVEFKRDNRDGSLRLMEINGRFWGSLQLPVDAGVDFPRLAVEVALDRPITPVLGYPAGLRSRWFWGDISAMVMLLSRSTRQLNLGPNDPGRWRRLRDFLRVFDRQTRNDVFRVDDWRPFLLESWRRLVPRRRN